MKRRSKLSPLLGGVFRDWVYISAKANFKWKTKRE